MMESQQTRVPDLLSRVSSGSADVVADESVIPRVGMPLPGRWLTMRMSTVVDSR